MTVERRSRVLAVSSGGDHLAELERLAKLPDAGALTDAEFEQQKAKFLGS
jgi:Short C-terminal domain